MCTTVRGKRVGMSDGALLAAYAPLMLKDLDSQGEAASACQRKGAEWLRSRREAGAGRTSASSLRLAEVEAEAALGTWLWSRLAQAPVPVRAPWTAALTLGEHWPVTLRNGLAAVLSPPATCQLDQAQQETQRSVEVLAKAVERALATQPPTDPQPCLALLMLTLWHTTREAVDVLPAVEAQLAARAAAAALDAGRLNALWVLTARAALLGDFSARLGAMLDLGQALADH